jgi:hypothetical protein
MRLFVVAIVAAALLAFSGAVLAQATTETFKQEIPVDFTPTNPCNGEPVHLTGSVNFVFHTTQDANGGFHLTGHAETQRISGTGLESGDKYRAVSAFNSTLNFVPEGAEEQTAPLTYSIISSGPSPNFVTHYTMHVTLNANGEPTAEVLYVRSECTGRA